MIKPLHCFFLLLLFLFASLPTNAQKFKWIKGGGGTNLMSPDEEHVSHICVDDFKNTYILAQVGPTNIKADTFSQTALYSFVTPHILFASYDCNGNMRFAKLIESRTTNYCSGLVYHKGKVYLAGTLGNNDQRLGYDATFSTYNLRVFIAKYDTSGQYNWTKFVGADNATTYAQTGGKGSLSVDGQDNIHLFTTVGPGVQLTPSVLSQAGTYDLKYNISGTLLSATKLQLNDAGYHLLRAEIDKSTGKYYALFQNTQVDITRSLHYFAAYNADGSQIWLDTIALKNNLNSFRVKSGDGIYVTGRTLNTISTFEFAGMKINTSIYPTGGYTLAMKLGFDGKANWMRKFDVSNSGNFLDLEVLPDYTLALVGAIWPIAIYEKDTFRTTTGESDNPWIVTMDTAGHLIDWREANGSGNNEPIFVVAADKYGSMYCGGQMKYDMKALELPKVNSQGGNADFFATKYGYDCNCTGVAPASDFSMTLDLAGRKVDLSYTGAAADSVLYRFGDGQDSVVNTLTHAFPAKGDTFTVCAIAYGPCGRTIKCKDVVFPNSVRDISPLQNIGIYPNPVTDLLTIDKAPKGTQLQLQDMMGRVLYKTILQTGKEQINTSNYPAGNYLIQLSDMNGNRVMRKIIKN